jgi:PKD repeat protein
MADTNEKPGGIRGLIKAGVTSVCGLVSGAALMYLTPLVDSVIKPAKPIANFAAQVHGFNVTFNNRCTGATQGWWDFGDGSALEPFSPKQETMNHTYTNGGSYTVKLTVQNLVAEQNERDATVQIEANSVATAPDVKNFKVTQITPTLFHLTARVENAQQCIWSLGDHRPLTITPNPNSADVERLIPIEKPGRHTLRLVAVNGSQLKEQFQEVVVAGPSAASAATASARLRVTYEGMDIDRQALQRNVPVPWTAGARDATCPFEVTRLLDHAHQDYLIVAADVVNKQDAQVRNLRVDIAPDKTRFVLRGELVHSSRWLSLSKQLPSTWVAQVALNVEKRSKPRSVATDEIPVSVALPGATQIPIPSVPAGMQMTQKHLHLELSDGSRVVWSGDQPPTNAIVQMGSRPVRVSAAEQANRLVLTIQDVSAPTSARPLGN